MKRLVTVLGLLTMWGCPASHLVYVQETNFGVDVSYSNEGTGHLVLGYDRQAFTLAPKKDYVEGDATSDDLMSLAAVSCVSAKGIGEIDFNHFVSTGEAAKAVVKDPDGIKRIRSAIYTGEACK